MANDIAITLSCFLLAKSVYFAYSETDSQCFLVVSYAALTVKNIDNIIFL